MILKKFLNFPFFISNISAILAVCLPSLIFSHFDSSPVKLLDP